MTQYLENVEPIFFRPSSPTPATSGGRRRRSSGRPAGQHRSTSAGARRSSSVQPAAVLPRGHSEDVHEEAAARHAERWRSRRASGGRNGGGGRGTRKQQAGRRRAVAGAQAAAGLSGGVGERGREGDVESTVVICLHESQTLERGEEKIFRKIYRFGACAGPLHAPSLACEGCSTCAAPLHVPPIAHAWAAAAVPAKRRPQLAAP